MLQRSAVTACVAVLGAAVLTPLALSQRPAAPAADAAPRWQLRSQHLMFGVPRATDDRHQVTGRDGKPVPGISVLVREGAVIGHYDRFKVPAWVAQRWTTEDYQASAAEPYNERNFAPDHELPQYARAETSYDFKTSKMTRGHMARQQDNKAWGSDNVDALCRMSNIVPQHEGMNGAAWGDLEDAHRKVVADGGSRIKAVWVISGPVFRRAGEGEDKPVMTVGNGVGVPWATYKVIGWFDAGGQFNERAYLVPQDAPKAKRPKDFLVTVDEVERLTGFDFFDELDDAIEDRLEAARYAELWR